VGAAMLYIDRRKEILENILKNGSAKVNELGRVFKPKEAKE
jgi:DeoR/GlpR family transcriptional regulator of sugar metabolism